MANTTYNKLWTIAHPEQEGKLLYPLRNFTGEGYEANYFFSDEGEMFSTSVSEAPVKLKGRRSSKGKVTYRLSSGKTYTQADIQVFVEQVLRLKEEDRIQKEALKDVLLGAAMSPLNQPARYAVVNKEVDKVIYVANRHEEAIAYIKDNSIPSCEVYQVILVPIVNAETVHIR